VGQLCADLLITSLSATRVGYLRTHAVSPVVGMGAFEEGVLSTALEVYRASKYNITIVQQRAPVMQGMVRTFVGELMGWISQAGFMHTLLLSSADASCRNDLMLAGQLHHVVNRVEFPMHERFTALGIPSLTENSRGEDEVFAPRRGFSRQLMEAAEEEAHPVGMLLSLCYEGDNVPQSQQLGAAVCCVLGLAEQGVNKLVEPQSWKHIRGAPFSTREMY